MELLEKFIKRLEQMNENAFECSKTWPDKRERPRFRNYMGALTLAIVEGKEILKQHKSLKDGK